MTMENKKNLNINTCKSLDVSIIIVNYNTPDLTIDCIESVRKHSIGVNYEIIIVDNASHDDSVEQIRRRYKKDNFIKIIKCKSNKGFGKANNIGAARARGKYLFLLNSDTVLLNNALDIFLKKNKELNKDYVLGTYLTDSKGNVSNSYSDIEDFNHIVVRILYLMFPILLSLRNKLNKTKDVFTVEKNVGFITGADMFVKAELFRKVGGFDEKFFMYCEDEDLCVRLSDIGVKSRIILGPQIIHLEGKSSKNRFKKNLIRIKSYFYFIRKNILDRSK